MFVTETNCATIFFQFNNRIIYIKSRLPEEKMSCNQKPIIGIAGAGMIGASLAALFTGHGFNTVLLTRTEESGKAGLQRYTKLFENLIEEELLSEQDAKTCKSYLSIVSDMEKMKECSIVFECFPENLEVKQNLYKDLDAHCPGLVAIASTTSALSPDDLSKGLGKTAEKIIVAHPFYPPHLIPFVEVVKGEKNAPGAVKEVIELLEECGRKPVVANISRPGFIANRLQHALLREAAYLVDAGIASPEDVDKALKYSFMPRYTAVGLFEHQDNAGLDLVKKIQDYLLPDLCSRETSPDFIDKLVDQGNLGIKTGKGIYDWNEEKAAEYYRKAGEPYLKFFNWKLPEDQGL